MTSTRCYVIRLLRNRLTGKVIMFAKSNLNGVACTYSGADACTPTSKECCAQNDAVYDYLLANTPPGTIAWNFDKLPGVKMPVTLKFCSEGLSSCGYVLTAAQDHHGHVWEALCRRSDHVPWRCLRLLSSFALCPGRSLVSCAPQVQCLPRHGGDVDAAVSSVVDSLLQARRNSQQRVWKLQATVNVEDATCHVKKG